ncbi:MAG: hypothetical protein ABSF15_21650 [Candidatus Sulfotelmatobacter sp.]
MNKTAAVKRVCEHTSAGRGRSIPASSSATSLVLLLSLVCVAQTGKVEKFGPLTDKGISEAVRQTLDSNGYRVFLEDGNPICELWLRKGVPSQTAKDIQSVAYAELAESTLVGVLHLLQAATDYRGDGIPVGFYTLRYALLPNDGNHLGAAPNRDFVLLIPASSDPDPNAVFKIQELESLSRKVTGAKHPAPLSLIQPDNNGKEPTVSKDDQDHWTFSASIKLASGQDLPFGLIVKGTTQQ